MMAQQASRNADGSRASTLMQRPVAPTISVVIPAYGHAHFIRQTLESVLGQTRPPSEVIVINDGSPDDTRGAVRPFMDRITYLEQENQGMVRTMNRARDLATGDYNFGVASDDWLEPDASREVDPFVRTGGARVGVQPLPDPRVLRGEVQLAGVRVGQRLEHDAPAGQLRGGAGPARQLVAASA